MGVCVCVCVCVCLCPEVPNKDYKDGRTWLGKSRSQDYKLVGVTWEISSERLQGNTGRDLVSRESANSEMMNSDSLIHIPGIQKWRLQLYRPKMITTCAREVWTKAVVAPSLISCAVWSHEGWIYRDDSHSPKKVAVLPEKSVFTDNKGNYKSYVTAGLLTISLQQIAQKSTCISVYVCVCVCVCVLVKEGRS